LEDPLVAVGEFLPEFGTAGVVAPAMDAAKAFVDAAAPFAACLLAGMSSAFFLLFLAIFRTNLIFSSKKF
jgi:hypothetical protein